MSPAPRLSGRERVAYRLGRLGFDRGDDAHALPHLEQLASSYSVLTAFCGGDVNASLDGVVAAAPVSDCSSGNSSSSVRTF